MANGNLQIYTALAEQAAPLPGVTVTVLAENGSTVATVTTDANGVAPELTLEAPDKAYSLDENNTETRPYAVYSLRAAKAGWQDVAVDNLHVFDGVQSVARLEFLPAQAALLARAVVAEESIDIPPAPLFTGGGGSGPAPAEQCELDDGGGILDEVVIPKKITVHLARPNVSASNVSVTFQKYIANVASSEVYPTWPEQALRANILAQISLALNRVYTEWYPSRGYSFNITNSPGVDQNYVNGRTVFAVMERLTAELFNTYVRRSGDAEPYYTEYCDGKTVSCPGMKQWGTVTRANEGLNALQILRYYYGNNVQLVTTNNIAAIPSSYPGTPLRLGSTGTAVNVIQRQLARIGKDYPSFGKPAVTGTFDAATESSVRAFQRQFSLTADGVVGKSTWYKISYIYVSVKDLAELTSEGEDFTGSQSAGTWPGVVLRTGSTGRNVEQVQFWLSDLAQFDSNLRDVTVDGNYGTGTTTAVRIFQERNGLSPDGAVGQATWEALYAAWVGAQSDIGGTVYPGTVLRSGSRGNDVRLIQFWLRMASDFYTSVPAVTVDGNYGSGTANAVTAFQNYFGLTADGAVGRTTWNKLREVFLAITNGTVSPGVRPGQYTATVREGSSGTAVRAVQYYLRLLSAYYSDVPSVTVDGTFGAATKRAVTAWQNRVGLTADGVVGTLTWQSLYTNATNISASGPVARLNLVEPVLMTLTLAEGDTGEGPLALSNLLAFLGQWIPEILPIEPTDEYTSELTEAVKSAQEQFGMEVTGIVTPDEWETFVAAGEALYSGTPAAAAPDPGGVWPGYTLAEGSAGPAVLQVQQWLNVLASVRCGAEFIPETGELDAATLDALESFQIRENLEPLGVVDDATWESLKAAAAPYIQQTEVQ